MTGSGRALRRILEERGIKHGFLAKKLQISHTLVGYWVRGERPIAPEYLPQIVKALNSAPRVRVKDLHDD